VAPGEPGSPPAPPPPTTLADGIKCGFYVTESLGPEDLARSVNREAVWQVSGARPGNGVDCLLDDSLETFWQSDGVSPHYIYIQFMRRTPVAEVCVYVDYKIDESYTPRKISLRSGTTHHDLEEVRALTLEKPMGWVRIPCGDPAARGAARFLRTWYLQLVVHFMHQQGRDTHIRCVKILGPPSIGAAAAAEVEAGVEAEAEAEAEVTAAGAPASVGAPMWSAPPAAEYLSAAGGGAFGRADDFTTVELSQFAVR